MENENQKPKLSFRDVFKIKDEICNSNVSCDTCPFCEKDSCIVNGDNIAQYVDEIEAICTEWEMNRPTLANKINEILKPYGMKLMHDYHYIWFNDGDMEAHTQAELINKLYTTKWKGDANE